MGQSVLVLLVLLVLVLVLVLVLLLPPPLLLQRPPVHQRHSLMLQHVQQQRCCLRPWLTPMPLLKTSCAYLTRCWLVLFQTRAQEEQEQEQEDLPSSQHATCRMGGGSQHHSSASPHQT